MKSSHASCEVKLLSPNVCEGQYAGELEGVVDTDIDGVTDAGGVDEVEGVINDLEGVTDGVTDAGGVLEGDTGGVEDGVGVTDAGGVTGTQAATDAITASPNPS